MNFDILIPVVAALAGTIVGAGLTFLMQIRTQRIEMRKQYRQSATNIALAEWQRRYSVLPDVKNFVPAITFIVEYAPKVEGILMFKDGAMKQETLLFLADEAENQIAAFLNAHVRDKQVN